MPRGNHALQCAVVPAPRSPRLEGATEHTGFLPVAKQAGQ